MQLLKQNGSESKIELVPLIDVIFLLLIFFLVTINIVPEIIPGERQESQFHLRVPGPYISEADMLIQLHQFPNDPQRRVYYYTFDRYLDPFDAGAWGAVVLFGKNIANLQSLNSMFPDHHFRRPQDIGLSGQHSVVISANEFVPYEKLHEVIQECVRHGVVYDFAVGSFEALPGRVHYLPPAQCEFITRW